MRIAAIVALSLLAALFLMSEAHAAESYGACDHTVTALPASIGTTGTWCVKQNLSFANASGIAINVTGNNVTIDCNGFALTGTAGTATTAVGIHALGKPGVAVRHCTLQGFQYGIELLDGTANLIEDNRLLDNTLVGLRIEGNPSVPNDSSIVRGNLILDTGGTPANSAVHGILAVGTVVLIDNTVSGVLASTGSVGYVFGIHLTSGSGTRLERNRVRIPAHVGTGKVYGIYSASSGGFTLFGNDVLGDGAAGSVGITCTGTIDRVQNTVVNGFATGMSGCGDAGRNDVSP